MLLSLVAGLLMTVIWIRALLRFVDMIGDVTFALAGGHYGTARLMRFCLKGELWLYAVYVIAYGAVVFGAGVVARSILLFALGGLFVLPVVFVLTYVVAVVVTTMAVGETLDKAAAQLAALDRSGRLDIAPRSA